MIVNLRRFIPGWLLLSGLILICLILLSGSLVFAARQQPDDGQTCLKIGPSSGPYSYIYFDANNGTRLNMPLDSSIPVSYQQSSSIIESPDHTKLAVVMQSSTAPISYLAVTNAINGKRRIRSLGTGSGRLIGWSTDGKYIAVLIRGIALQPSMLVILSGHDLTDVLREERAASNGTWSTIGHRLAFFEQHDAKAWLTIIDVDQFETSRQITQFAVPDDFRVYTGDVNVEAPIRWSPDGQYLALITRLSAFVTTTQPGSINQVSNQLLPFGSDKGVPNPRWLPDTSELLYVDFPPQVNTPGTLRAYSPAQQKSRILATHVLHYIDYAPDMRQAIVMHLSTLDAKPAYSLLTVMDATEVLLTDQESVEYRVLWSNSNRRPNVPFAFWHTLNGARRVVVTILLNGSDENQHWIIPNVGQIDDIYALHWFTCANLS